MIPFFQRPFSSLPEFGHGQVVCTWICLQIVGTRLRRDVPEPPPSVWLQVIQNMAASAAGGRRKVPDNGRSGRAALRPPGSGVAPEARRRGVGDTRVLDPGPLLTRQLTTAAFQLRNRYKSKDLPLWWVGVFSCRVNKPPPMSGRGEIRCAPNQGAVLF